MSNNLFFTFFIISNFLSMSIYSQGRLDKQTVLGGYEYITYLPEGYDAAQSLPLLLYLHGGEGINNGENGFSDFSKFKNGLPPIIHNKLNPPGNGTTGYLQLPTEDFIIVVPHLPRDATEYPRVNDQLWDIGKVAKVMNDAIRRYKVNRDNIYMSGISLGAKGVWDYVVTDLKEDIPYFEDDFIKPSAIVVIGGNADPEKVCRMKDIPVWALHGNLDSQVPADGRNDQGRFGSQILIEEYNKCNPDKVGRLSLLDGTGHTKWNQYYDGSIGYDIYEWLLLHGKNREPNIPPLINIASSKTLNFQKNVFFTEKGEAFDPEGDSLNMGWEIIDNNEKVEIFNSEDPTKLYVKFITPGNFVFRFSASDGINQKQYKDLYVKVLEEVTSEKAPFDLYFYDFNKKEDIGNKLENRQRINTENFIGKEVSLRAETNNNPGSIKFALNNNRNYFIANNHPYIMNDRKEFGKEGIWSLKKGENIITVTAYNNKNPSSDEAVTLSVTLYVDEEPIVLPVEFLSISVNRTGNKITISWSTASESRNDFFTIERSSSTAHNHFEAIGTQPGAGNSREIKHYQFIDIVPFLGQAYYRIKQTDINGKSTYSKIVTLNGTNKFDVTIFPNPTDKGNIFIKLTTSDNYTPVNVVVLDAMGNTAFKGDFLPEQLLKENGFILESFKMIPGLYFMITSQGQEKAQKKLVVK